MTFSIGQVDREKGDYVEIVKTNVILKENRFLEIKSVCKSIAFQCYESVSASLISLFDRFKSDKRLNEWISIEDSAPDTQEGLIYSKEVLAVDKYGDIYLALYNDKFLTWHDSVTAPLGRIENITHWMHLSRPKDYL